MKRIITIVLCIAMIAAMFVPALAAGQENIVYSEDTVLEDGTVMTDELILSSGLARANKTAIRRRTFTREGVTIGVIAFEVTYGYASTMVYVISKSVTQTDTYDGWNYKQSAFTTNGGTVTLEGKLTKLLVVNVPFTMSMTCDKSGNITIA